MDVRPYAQGDLVGFAYLADADEFDGSLVQRRSGFRLYPPFARSEA